MFSIVEFGSVVRGSNDEHSDKDLLIICNRSSNRVLRERYEANGYSVSTLTPGQLISMQRRGSLFVQHLKIESRILFDYQSRFQDWINSCQLVKPSIDEVNRCASSIVFLCSWPSDSRLDAWKADFLYCISRDFLIKNFAMRSRLVFGLEDIEYALQEIEIFPNLDMRSLRRLREIKSAYRSGYKLATNVCEAINYHSNSLIEGLGLPQIKSGYDSAESFVMSLSHRQFNSAYEELRSLEAAYLIARSNGLYHPAHKSLIKFIRSPNAYGSSQARNRKKLGEYMEDVLAMLANKVMHATSA